MNSSFSDLTPETRPAANGGEPAVASADTSVSRTDGSFLSPPRAGVVRRAHSPNSERGTRNAELKGALIDAVRPLVIKEILELLGKDIPCARLHTNYLNTLHFAKLCARRDQLKAEIQPELDHPKRKRLELQPELELGIQEGRKP